MTDIRTPLKNGFVECWTCGVAVHPQAHGIAQENGKPFCGQCVDRYLGEEPEINRPLGVLDRYSYGDRRGNTYDPYEDYSDTD